MSEPETHTEGTSHRHQREGTDEHDEPNRPERDPADRARRHAAEDGPRHTDAATRPTRATLHATGHGDLHQTSDPVFALHRLCTSVKPLAKTAGASGSAANNVDERTTVTDVMARPNTKRDKSRFRNCAW
jgi:hypothetical protein